MQYVALATVEGDLAVVKEASYTAKGKALSVTKEGLDKAISVNIEETLIRSKRSPSRNSRRALKTQLRRHQKKT